MSNELRVEICSPPDRELLVASLMAGNVQWGEVNQESGHLRVEIYPDRSGKAWDFKFDELLQTLQSAKQRLLGSDC